MGGAIQSGAFANLLAHIKIESCNSRKSIKYICKFVNKVSDQAVFDLEKERDQVAT